MGIPWREALAASFIKRSNKDLVRVLAIATMIDLDDYQPWSRSWLEALRTCSPNEWSKLALWAGAGLRALLGSGNDFEEAYHKGGWNFIRSLGCNQVELNEVGSAVVRGGKIDLSRAKDATEGLEDFPNAREQSLASFDKNSRPFREHGCD